MKSSLTLILLAGAVCAAAFVLRAGGAELDEATARQHLKAGAVLMDVRTVEEFKARSVNNATNVPLAELNGRISSVVTNKSAPVLLYCRSGRRSGIAEKQLRELGYTNAFNIGSFERAEKIVGEKR